MKEIDWTKPIEVDNPSHGGVKAEYVGRNDTNGERYVRVFNAVTGEEMGVRAFDEYGNAAQGNRSMPTRNIPEPKRRGELFVTVFEREDGSIASIGPHCDPDYKITAPGFKKLATVKIGEWEEGQ